MAARIEVAETFPLLVPQSRRLPRGLHPLIGKRIADTIKPRFLRIASYWNPRGGIPIDVFWQTGKLPAGVSLPDTGIGTYRGAAERRGSARGPGGGIPARGCKAAQLALVTSLAIIFPF